MSSSKGRGGGYRRPRYKFLPSLFSRMLAAYLTVTLSMIFIVGVTVVALQQQQNKKEIKAALLTFTDSLYDTLSKYDLSSVSDENGQSLYNAFYSDYLSSLSESSGYLIQVYSENNPTESYSDGSAAWLSLTDKDTLSYSVLLPLPDHYAMEDCLSLNAAEKNSIHTFSVKTDILPSVGEGLLMVSARYKTFYNMFKESFVEIVLVMLATAFIAVIVVYSTTERMLRPFLRINSIVQRYSKGDFNVRIPLSGADEATQLAKSFNEMADQLNDLEATRKSFVANVSHELRSPLTSMRGFLEAMQDGTIPAEDYEKYIDIVLSETKRMTTMVNDTLNLARIESGKTALHLETFDINELIRRTLLTFEARISEHRMDVEVRFAQEQYFVEADSGQISQVLRNLIDNAIKYSPEDSKLRLATYAMHRSVYVTVQDSGQGIPEEDIPHVFDRFYKVEKAHTPTKQSGTGLGLSIVKKIMDQHGQSITVQSTKGKGTTFTFTLKRVASANKKQTVIPDGGAKYGI